MRILRPFNVLAATLLISALASVGARPILADHDSAGMSADEARSHVEDLKVGTDLDEHGVVRHDEGHVGAGSSVFASFRVHDLAVGSEIQVSWIGPHDDRIFVDTEPLQSGVKYMVFKAPDTASWRSGEYRVEVRLSNQIAAKEDFKVR